MTEAEWMISDDARSMLEWRGAKASERKLRLLACAWCRLRWPLLADPRSRLAVDAAERYAEDRRLPWPRHARHAACEAMLDASAAYATNASPEAREAMQGAEAAHGTTKLGGEDAAWRVAGNADVLRDVVGNPFRRVRLEPVWRTPTVYSLALAAYEERTMPTGELDSQRLSVLADAMEEVGAGADVVAHLRGPGPHVRGCWAVDLCLWRE